jgi:serine/threonine protein kinase
MSRKDTERERLAGYCLWGHKTIGACIGRGTFGSVYELADEQRGTVDALKVVTVEYTEEETEPDRQKYLLNGLRSTLDEVQRMMELKDLEHFVSIYGYENYPIREQEELVGYDILIWMEKLTVLPDYLEQRRQQGAPLGERDFLQMGVQLCRGLEAANARFASAQGRETEFIHRDIKPENIFVSDDGTYKLGDLGVAATSQPRRYTVVGTPNYMAPEMFGDCGYHANVDLFALGKTLERLTNGRNLVSGLEQVLHRAQEREPSRRYQTAQEMRLDLEQCIRRLDHVNPEGEPTLPASSTEVYGRREPTECGTERMTRPMPANLPKTPEAPERPKRRGVIGLLAAAAAVVLVAAALVGVRFWQNQQLAAQEEAEKAKKAEIQASIEREMQQNNYAEAILSLQDALEDDPEESTWSELLAQCEESYRADVLDRAAAAYEEQDNEAAAQIVRNGLEILPEDAVLQRYAQAYEQSEPQTLDALPLVSSNSREASYYADGTIQDKDGTSYNGYFQLTSWGGWKGIGEHSAFCTYALNGAYQWLEASYFADPLGEAEDSIHFLVLADDTVIYDSGAVSAGSGSESIRLDVSGVQELTIRSETDDYSIFGTNPSIFVVETSVKKVVAPEDEP